MRGRARDSGPSGVACTALGQRACTPRHAPSTPPTKDAAGLLRPAGASGVIWTHPREQRHVVGALEHVDRVDLQHTGARERAREGAHRRGGVARVAEALCGTMGRACARDSCSASSPTSMSGTPDNRHQEWARGTTRPAYGMSRSFSRTAYMTASIRRVELELLQDVGERGSSRCSH